MFGEYFPLTKARRLYFCGACVELYPFTCGKYFVLVSKSNIMEEVTAILISLQEQVLEANKKQDFNFYEKYLADIAIAVAPCGIYDKKAIIRQMGTSASSLKNIGLSDTKTIVLTAESGIVTYKAQYEHATTRQHLEMYVTTVYAKIGNEWKGIFYQQTVLNN